MKKSTVTKNSVILIDPIRIEAALYCYPIHRLAKHGDYAINIRQCSEDGDTLVSWKVSYNSEYGPPGPLAYKLDTLIINRRIDETSRPITKMIRLGSFRQIKDELGIETHNTEQIKKALYQNAFAAINATISYKQKSGTMRNVEIADTRYGVVFTGETLPDGRIADAVYIILHDFYKSILDNARTRPLDYAYLKQLKPAAQRLYELLSYHIFHSLKYDKARAKLVYSEFCAHAPQNRYFEFDQVKKQMSKLNSVHKKSGYISKMEYHQTTDAEGKADWIMLFMPGPKARAEFRTFNKRSLSPAPQNDQDQPKQEILPPLRHLPDLEIVSTPKRQRKAKASEKPAPSPLVAELIQIGVTEEIAGNLVEQFPERIQLQIEYLKWELAKRKCRIEDPAAYLVAAISKGITPPKRFVPKAERERQAEAKRQADQQAAEERQRKQQEAAREQRLAEQTAAYLKSRSPEQLARLEADAIAQASEETRQGLDQPHMKPFRKTQLFVLVREHVEHLVKSGQLAIEPA